MADPRVDLKTRDNLVRFPNPLATGSELGNLTRDNYKRTKEEVASRLTPQKKFGFRL